MISPFSMVSGASTALGARSPLHLPLLSAVTLRVGGLLTPLLHDLDPHLKVLQDAPELPAQVTERHLPQV